jgi:N6-adenosine-specific RNA methylase IME4
VSTSPISRMWPLRRAGWRTVVADPPWMFNDQGSRLGTTRCSSPYRPMPDEQILALPVGKLAAADSHLYLWATDQHTELAFQCVRAWGFRFVQFITWVKVDAGDDERLGGGHYYRHAAEQCLFAVRGRAPVRRRDVPAVFRAPRGRHSGKPDKFFDLVEAMSFGPRVELFSRVERIGWHCHGDQVRGRAA